MEPKEPFDRVVTQHGPTVLRVARAVVGASDADDVWSETFIAALRAYPDLPADANIEAWLVTIAHRKALDSIRSGRRRAIPLGELPETAGANPAEDHDLDLTAAVRALPDRQRHAVAYHYLAGLPYAEIAALLGSSEAAARRAAADGIRTLRRRYPDSPHDGPTTPAPVTTRSRT
ncbi:MAG: hypothetical protein JWO63_47 [Frankiales bacterium]|jgi:RNA polymerase sigma factor (sigma-70 family)|nr:hypothetical protein [Frankiales bacterium]